MYYKDYSISCFSFTKDWWWVEMRQSVSTNLCGFVTYQCIKRTKNANGFRKIHTNNNIDKNYRK